MSPEGSDRTGRARDERCRPRVTDRVEDVVAWLLMSASLVLLVGSWTLGHSVQTRMSDATVTIPPTHATEAWSAGVLVGFDVLLLGGVVLVGIWMGVRRLTASVNAAVWEREWAQVGPHWSGHVR